MADQDGLSGQVVLELVLRLALELVASRVKDASGICVRQSQLSARLSILQSP